MRSKALGVSPLHYPETPVILASPWSFMQSLASILCTFWSLGSKHHPSTCQTMSYTSIQLSCQTGKLFSYYLLLSVVENAIFILFCMLSKFWCQLKFLSFVSNMVFYALVSAEFFLFICNLIVLLCMSQSWLYRSVFQDAWWAHSICRFGLCCLAL